MKKHNKHVKSWLAFALALIMVLSACPMAGFVGLIAAAADRQGSAESAGTYWEYYSDGELWFTGDILPVNPQISESGAITVDNADLPWKTVGGEDFSAQVKSITITKNCAEIGQYALINLRVSAVYIPTTVTKVDAKAFLGSLITDVYFAGSQAQWKTRVTNGSMSGVVVHYNHTHANLVTKHVVAATCTKAGYDGDKYCPTCGAFAEKGKATEKASHTWSTGYATETQPTCQNVGYKAHYCIICGTFDYSSRVSIPATGKHEWVVLPADKFGKREQDTSDVSKKCSAHVGEQIVMHCKNCTAATTDADFQKLEYKDAAGNVVAATKADYDKLSEELKKTVVNKEEADDNWELRDRCTVKKDANGAVIHQYTYTDNVQEDKDDEGNVLPVCLQKTVRIVTCEWCTGYSETKELPAPGHSDVATGETRRISKAADCENTGWIREICTVCAEVLSEQEIPNRHAEGYRSGTWKVAAEPDCVNDGEMHLWCNYCGKEIMEPKLDANGQPMLDENGNEKLEYVQKIIPKTPDVHTPSRWIRTLDATCTEKGEEVKICTVDGCPYYSRTDLGALICKVSDRKALNQIIAVTQDTDDQHYNYKTNFETDEPDPRRRVTDVANEINLAILGIYKKYDFPEELTDAQKAELKTLLIDVFTTAANHHGFWYIDKTNGEQFDWDRQHPENPKSSKGVYDIVKETASDKRIVFSQIVDKAADLLIEKDSVINTTEDVVAFLEQAWIEVGDAEDIDPMVTDEKYKDQIAEVTDKALAKQEIPALNHNFVRCTYYFFELDPITGASKYTPAVKDGESWCEIADYKLLEKNIDGETVTYTYTDGEGEVTLQESDVYQTENNEFIRTETGKKILKDDFAEDAEGNIYKIIAGDATDKTPVKGYPINCVQGGGTKISQCTRCKELADPVFVKKGSHVSRTEYVAPTCAEDGVGYDRTYCTLCDYETVWVKEVPLTHNYVETTIKESTCSKAGIKIKICSYCGDVKKSTYQTLALLPHTDSPVYDAATCTESGRDGKVCSVCGRFEGKILPALDHDYVANVTDPTCTELGYTIGVCSRCGDETAPYNYVPVAGHQYGDPQYKDATCVDGSYTFEECVICHFQKKYNERDNALGHDWKDATCTAPKTCDRCGTTEGTALGHIWKTVEAVAATCTEDGHNTYVVCEREGCGAYQQGKEKVVDPAIGHAWKFREGFAATCTESGMNGGYYCDQCKTWDPDRGGQPSPISPLGHQYGDWTVEKEATAFKAGKMVHTCNRCGDTEEKPYTLNFWQSVWWIIKYLFSIPFRIARAISGGVE